VARGDQRDLQLARQLAGALGQLAGDEQIAAGGHPRLEQIAGRARAQPDLAHHRRAEREHERRRPPAQHAGGDPRDRLVARQRGGPAAGEPQRHALDVAERAAIGQRQADRVGQAGVVAQPRVLVERQVVGRQRHVVGQERLQPPRGRPGHRRQPGAPDQAVVDHDQIGAEFDGAVEQHLVGRHAGDHGVDLGRALDLQAVGRIVAEAIDLERGVEVGHDVAEVDGHRGGAP
jgi:hypothetical protein